MSPVLPVYPVSPLPVISLAIPIASLVLVLVLASLYEVRKNNKHRSLFGKVLAPGPYADTTLLVTDIQVRARLVGKI